MKHIQGVYMSSGSLGQVISAAVGMALAGKMDGKDYRVYTHCGDGEIEEGQVWEASMFVGYRKLDNLVVIVDNNGLQIDGPIDEVCSPNPIDEKSGLSVSIWPKSTGMISTRSAQHSRRRVRPKGQPTAIIAKTVKGKGVSYMENQVDWHGKAPNDER